jgi:hypothetical protein
VEVAPRKSPLVGTGDGVGEDCHASSLAVRSALRSFRRDGRFARVAGFVDEGVLVSPVARYVYSFETGDLVAVAVETGHLGGHVGVGPHRDVDLGVVRLDDRVQAADVVAVRVRDGDHIDAEAGLIDAREERVCAVFEACVHEEAAVVRLEQERADASGLRLRAGDVVDAVCEFLGHGRE